MATKATAGRKAAIQFLVSGSTITPVFSAVRNWTLRVERKVIDATNNDSSAWRELVLPTAATAVGAKNAGQMNATLHAEAVFDLNPLGPGGVAGRSQPYDRRQIMRHLVDGRTITNLNLVVGVNPGVGPLSTAGQWALISQNAVSPAAFVESVEVGGSYDEPVLYDITFRFNAAVSGI